MTPNYAPERGRWRAGPVPQVIALALKQKSLEAFASRLFVA